MPTYEGTSDTCMRVNFSELGPFSTSNEETVRSTFQRTGLLRTYSSVKYHRTAEPPPRVSDVEKGGRLGGRTRWLRLSTCSRR